MRSTMSRVMKGHTWGDVSLFGVFSGVGVDVAVELSLDWLKAVLDVWDPGTKALRSFRRLRRL
jgi:hypothetical protein